MASVLIIDDDRSSSAFLKLSLMQKRHRVRRSRDIREAVNLENGRTADVVLINQATDNCSGWALFNQLKQLAPELPTLVYVLDRRCGDSADWICRAVDAVCVETGTSPAPHRYPSMLRWG